MKATYEDALVDRQGRRLTPMSLQQRKELRKHYVAQIPRWRRSWLGYVLSLPLVGLALLGTLTMQSLMVHLYFLGSLFVLAVLCMALIWGVGPALFTLLASTLVLDYFFLLPGGQFAFYSWPGALQLVPFVVSGLVIALITAERERARLHTLSAERELQIYAEELEATNEKLAEANHAKDRFLSIASHELKTPITTIRGHTQLMHRRLSKQHSLSPEMTEIGKSLEKINDQTTRLTGIIDELLDISSIRAGRVALRRKECDIIEVCRSVVEDQRLLTGRPINIDVSLVNAHMLVDRDRIAQVLVNLLSNAVKYSPEGSPVKVGVEQHNNNVLMHISDQGKGIAKNEQAHIFETFYRTSDAQTSSKTGLGLGLAISKDIVERHDGRIWCESEPGKGSTFFVELPGT